MCFGLAPWAVTEKNSDCQVLHVMNMQSYTWYVNIIKYPHHLNKSILIPFFIVAYPQLISADKKKKTMGQRLGWPWLWGMHEKTWDSLGPTLAWCSRDRWCTKKFLNKNSNLENEFHGLYAPDKSVLFSCHLYTINYITHTIYHITDEALY